MTQFYPDAIRIPFRDDRVYPLRLYRNGAAFDASGWKIFFNVKTDPAMPDDQSLIAKTIDFDDVGNDAANSTAYLVITGGVDGDTDNNIGRYHYNMRVIDDEGKSRSTKISSFIIEQVVNRDGA